MANRAKDWVAQARHDIDHARHALDDGDYEWACFAAQQGAEKAVKGCVRYPNGFDVGTPKDYYTVEEARLAIDDAEQIYHFCKLSVS